MENDRMENPAIVTSVQFVALKLACPRCGTPVSLLGRLELTPRPPAIDPCCHCEQCGRTVYLVVKPPGG